MTRHCVLCGARGAKNSRQWLCQRHIDLVYYRAIEDRVAKMPLYSSTSDSSADVAADL